MKFVCDSCNTKYSIADERVHGRVLKIRCKTCDHVITVREEMKAPDSASSMAEALGRRLGDEPGSDHTMVSSSPPAAPADKADEWYVSFDGEQEGPLTLARALERVRAERPSGREAHCWRPGFFVWLAVEEVPEFAPALARPRRTSSPPPPPAASPSRPISVAAGVAKPAPSPMPATPAATAPGPTLSMAPVSLAPVGGGLEPLPPLDSKPVPLPPPPELLKDLPLNLPLPSGQATLPGGEPVPSEPMSLPLTKPEPRVARRAEAAESVATPVPVDKPVERPREPAAPEISAFAAALAAATGKEPRQDTGPVPLPPPPGSDEADLAISEPSGLLNISHLNLSPSPSPLPRSSVSDKAVFDTFGGVAVTPAGSNGATASAPVVVVAGPVQSAAAWVKWSVAALLVLVVGLAGTVVYLWSGRHPIERPLAGGTTPGGKHVDDQPIEVNDPAPPTSIGTPTAVDPKKSPLKPHAPTVAKTNPGAPGVKPASLSNDQKNLAALYGESGEKAAPKETATGDHSERGQGQVSQTSILAVVTQNRRALNLCYDRVLKHDSTLKRARLVTHVKVGISGIVTGVSIPDPTYADSEIGQCLTQTIKRWHFPSAESEYETEFPIILQAE